MKKDNILYYVAIFGVFFINLCDISKIINITGTLRNAIYIILALLLVAKIILTKYTKKQLLAICIFGVISLYTSYILDNYMFIMNFLGIVGIKGVKINTVIKLDITVKVFFLILHTAIYSHDYFFNYEKVVPTFMYTNAYGIRQSFYFSHANTATGIVAWTVIEAIYVMKNKKMGYVLGTIVMIIYCSFTVSRTAIIVYMIFLLLSFINYKNEIFFRKTTNFLLKYLIDILCILSIILVLLPSITTNSTIIKSIDTILSKRLYYSQWALNSYGFNFLPNVNTRILEESLIIDNFYIRCFVSYGFITYLILTIMYKMLKKTIPGKDRIILIITPLYLFNELFCFNIGRAIPLLILANQILNNKEKRNENEININNNTYI